MTARNPVKGRSRVTTRIVGVIASAADLRIGHRMREKPDLFELRLDYLAGNERRLERALGALDRPLIITARHPGEGGAHALKTSQRRELLTRFLPFAQYVDVELRSAESFHSLLRVGGNRKVKRILSFHDFDSSPTRGSLHAKARRAAALGADIFKIAVRTDTNAQLARLLEFFVAARSGISLSAMGIGRLGGISRVLLAQCGSVLTYAALGSKTVHGQLTVEELRLALRLFQSVALPAKKRHRQ